MVKDDIPIKLEWATTLYMNFRQEIRFLKNQQWLALAAVVALDAGIYRAVQNSLWGPGTLGIVCLALLLTTLGGLRFVARMQQGMQRSRRHLANVKQEYRMLNNMIAETELEREMDRSGREDNLYRLMFGSAMILSPLFFLGLLITAG